MPKTKFYTFSNFEPFLGDIRAQMGRNRLSMADLGSRSVQTYYNLLRDPWRFRMDDLCEVLGNLGFDEDMQEEMVVRLYREVRKDKKNR